MRIGFYCLYSLFKRCITLNVPCYVSTLVCFWQDGRTEEKRWWQFEQCFHNRKITLQGEYTGNSRKILLNVRLFVCLFVCLFVTHLYTRGCRTGVKGFINFGHYSVPTQQCARWALETIGAETAAAGKRNFPHPPTAFSNGIPGFCRGDTAWSVENPSCRFTNSVKEPDNKQNLSQNLGRMKNVARIYCECCHSLLEGHYECSDCCCHKCNLCQVTTLLFFVKGHKSLV